MSYILEALRKAERERGGVKKHTPNQSAEHWQDPNRDRLLIISVIAGFSLLSISIVATVLWFYHNNQSTAIQIIRPAVIDSNIPTSKNNTTYRDVPFYEDLTKDIRVGLPNITINAHVHAAKNPKASFVILSGERLRNQQRSKAGLTVLNIEPTAIVLEYDKISFRFPVQQ